MAIFSAQTHVLIVRCGLTETVTIQAARDEENGRFNVLCFTEDFSQSVEDVLYSARLETKDLEKALEAGVEFIQAVWPSPTEG